MVKDYVNEYMKDHILDKGYLVKDYVRKLIREKEKNNWENNNHQGTRIEPEENKGVELKIEGARRK